MHGAIVVQEVEESFRNRLLVQTHSSSCRSVLEQATEPPTAPNVQVDILDSSLGVEKRYITAVHYFRANQTSPEERWIMGL